VVKHLYDHPEGLDPPYELEDLCTHVKRCKRFTTVEAKKGDVFLLHGLLPHSNNFNYLHYARVITNPHVNLREPYNLNRPDGDYVSGTWCRSFDLPHLTSHLTSPHLTSPHPTRP
jgi:hypothetical protein